MKKFNFDSIPPVETTAGLVKGYQFGTTYTFKGIPYAEAKRFQMPTAPTPWEGVKDATSYGMVHPLMSEEVPTGELLVPHRYWPQSEHCQSVNIWTQSIDKDAKKPVLVWLHGGGFFAGSSIEQKAYNGDNLSVEGDIVVVSLNHRLNILGFMDLSPFGDKYKNSANAGLADLVESLRWIRDNIANFGGDPDNVTIFGQSGGGMKVSALMQIPEAEGLFHKGMIMSGVAGDFMPAYENISGEKIVNALLEELKFDDVEQLETVPFLTLVDAYNKVAPPLMMQGEYVGNNPAVDDYYLGEPQVYGFSEQAKKTPILIGSVYGEFNFAPSPYNKHEMSEEEMLEVVRERFQDNTEEIVQLFKEAYPNREIIDLTQLDMLFRPLKTEYALAKAKHPESETYSYMFNLDFPVQNDKPAWHCADIPFFFNNIELVPSANIDGVSEKLQSQMAQALINFTKTGNPNHEGIPTWNPTTEGNEETIIFDKEVTVANNFDHKLMKRLSEVLPKMTIADILGAGDVQH